MMRRSRRRSSRHGAAKREGIPCVEPMNSGSCASARERKRRMKTLSTPAADRRWCPKGSTVWRAGRRLILRERGSSPTRKIV